MLDGRIDVVKESRPVRKPRPVVSADNLPSYSFHSRTLAIHTLDHIRSDIKMRDSEGIQLANAKIDEIRNGFSEWLEEQSPQFKERLVTM